MSALPSYTPSDIHQTVAELIVLTHRLEIALEQKRAWDPYMNLKTLEDGLRAAKDYLAWLTKAIEKDGF